MAKGSVAKFFDTATKALKKHSPEILTGLGIAGMITTTVFAVRATPKALRLIEERKKQEGATKLTPVETVQTCWKCYIPSVVIGAASTACIIGATSVSARRHAALATAYALSESSMKEYQEKVVEVIGEKKERAVRDRIAEDQADKNPVSKNDVIITGKGHTLIYDHRAGRWFESDIDALNKAMIAVNYLMLSETYACLNDFYYELGLDNTDYGAEVGWDANDGKVELALTSKIADDGRPCIVLNFDKPPKYNFDKY